MLSGNDDERKNAEAWLLKWEQSLKSIESAIEIIETSFNQNDLFFAGKAIFNIIIIYGDSLEYQTLERIFGSLQRRINNSLGQNLTELCLTKLIDCITEIAYLSNEFIDKFLELSVQVFPRFFRNLLDKTKTGDQNFASKMYSFIDNIFDVLRQADVSEDWIYLLVSTMGMPMFEDSFQPFYEFLEKLETISANPGFYAAFLDLLNFVLSVFYENDSPFLIAIMKIAINVCDVLISEPTDYTSLQQASYIITEIIDYDDHEAGFFVDNSEFSFNLFQHIADIMPSFVEQSHEILNIYYTLSEQLSSLYYYPDNPGFLDFVKLIPQYLDFLILQIDHKPDEYFNNETSSIINTFTSICQSKDDQFFNLLGSYFKSKFNQGLTNGLIFAISSSSPLIQEIFVKLSPDIFKSPLTPFCFYFIRKFCRSMPVQHLPIWILKVYGEFMVNPISSARAIKSFVRRKEISLSFIKNEKLIDQIFQWINDSTPEVSIYLNQALLRILHFLKSYQINLELEKKIIHAIINSYGFCFTYVLDTGEPQLLSLYLNKFTKIALEMSEMDNFVNTTCDVLKCAYINIFKIFEPLWLNVQQENVSETLCNFLDSCIQAKIVDNYDQILQWIGISIHQTPTQAHFNLLKNFIEYLPTENIMSFLLSIYSIPDDNIIFNALCFIKILLDKKWPNFFDYFSIQFLTMPLSSTNCLLYDTSLSIINSLIYLLPSEELKKSIEEILLAILKGIFTNIGDRFIEIAIQIILSIIKKELYEPIGIVQIVFENFKNMFCTSEDAINFQKAFLENINNPDKLFRIIKRTINIYHEQS